MSAAPGSKRSDERDSREEKGAGVRRESRRGGPASILSGGLYAALPRALTECMSECILCEAWQAVSVSINLRCKTNPAGSLSRRISSASPAFPGARGADATQSKSGTASSRSHVVADKAPSQSHLSRGKHSLRQQRHRFPLHTQNASAALSSELLTLERRNLSALARLYDARRSTAVTSLTNPPVAPRTLRSSPRNRIHTRRD